MTNLSTVDWSTIIDNLNNKGFARIPGILDSAECKEIRGIYNDTSLYRNVINMHRYRFGQGEYKYFSYPLPQVVQSIRENSYVHLASLANEWMKKLKIDKSYPSTHKELIKQCNDAGQSRPTPLILRYDQGGFNTLHQDLYGDVFFPFQMVIMLSKPDEEFTGGEFIMVEQIPRAQSRAHVVRMEYGDAVIFTCSFRPASGQRGYYRCNMKHGISEVSSGERFALGIIYHDAK